MAVIDVSKYTDMDARFKDAMYRLWGPTLMCFPEDTDSNRSIMGTSQQKQILNLAEPDVPYILTGSENTFGRYNKAYRALKGTWEVLDKIDKFGDGMVYTLVLYCRETHTYDMLQNVVAVPKAEKFGYLFNNEVMDSLQPGQIVKDKVIARSTSYDEHMNYRLGRNALVMYSTSNPTIEDAIYVRKGWAEKSVFFELDNIQVMLNDNDVFTNRYGTDEHYVPFPLVGEYVQGGVICSTRRVVKDHVLFDFQSKNLREYHTTDTEYYTSKNALVYDIDVLYNGTDDIPDNIFNARIRMIYEQCCTYADRITEWGLRIKDMCKDGKSRYTQRIPFLLARNQKVSDRSYTWRYKEREFANMLINFKTYARVSLEAGFKLVGRYGDKGVISKVATDSVAEDTGEVKAIQSFISNFKDVINGGRELTEEELAANAQSFHVVEDSEMPYMEDGTKVDILLNASGAIRRLNNGQLVEVDLAFQMECIRKRICELDDLDEKYNMLFQFLEIVNKDEYKFFYDKYTSWTTPVTIESHTIMFLNQKERRAFMEDVEKNGIRLVKPPHKCIRYDTVKEVYHTFPWIQPVQLYIDKFGIARKPIMRKCIVGHKYIYVLKQTSNKNFSARSMGRVNKKGLPEKSTDKRDNRSEISHNPLKLGEVHNLMSSVSGREMAEHNIFTRSSPVGRKSLRRILKASGDPMKIHKLKIEPSFRNVNADIFNAYIKCWGIRTNFINDRDEADDAWIDIPQVFTVHGIQVLDQPSRRQVYAKLFDRYDEIFHSTIIVAPKVDEFIWDMIFKEDAFKDTPADMQQVCRNAVNGYYAEHTAVEEDEE